MPGFFCAIIILMNFYTIKPLAEAFTQHQRDYLKFGDLVQIEAKTRSQRQRKLACPAQKHAHVVEDNYLKILAHVKEQFTGTARLSQREIFKISHAYLEAHKFIYFAKRHRPACKNLFYTQPDKVYDVAFYIPQNARLLNYHHTHKNEQSIFYARFEEKNDHVLIGNLQIDDRHPGNSWQNAATRTILLMKKNLYRAMLQESLKFAIKTKKKKILFQTGDADLYTQKTHSRTRLGQLKITPDNYADYQKLHENVLKRFDTLQPGMEALNFNYTFNTFGIIITKTADAYTSLFAHDSYLPDDLLNSIISYYDHTNHNATRRTQKSPTPIGNQIYFIHETITRMFFARQPASALRAVNKIFRLLDHNYIERHWAEKLAYLKKNLNAPYPPLAVLDRFLIKFNYHKIFLRTHPAIKEVKISRTLERAGFTIHRFYDTRYEKQLTETIRKTDIIKPELGHTYIVDKKFPGQALFRSDFFEKRMYNFYDQELPKLFTAAGLKFRRRAIYSRHNGRAIKSTAWEIKTGVEKFKAAPLIIF